MVIILWNADKGKVLSLMSSLHTEGVGAASQWQLPGKHPLIHVTFPMKPPLFFEQKYVVLTGIHSSHLRTGSLLFSYKQMSTGQNLPPLKPVAKRCLSLLQHNMHSISLQGKKEREAESYSSPITLQISLGCPFFLARLSTSCCVHPDHEL